MPQKILTIKQQQQNGEVDPEMRNFVDNLRSQVEIFVNRMKSDSSRGRSIANDSSVQTLFMNITALHSRYLYTKINLFIFNFSEFLYTSKFFRSKMYKCFFLFFLTKNIVDIL